LEFTRCSAITRLLPARHPYRLGDIAADSATLSGRNKLTNRY